MSAFVRNVTPTTDSRHHGAIYCVDMPKHTKTVAATSRT